MAGLVVSTKTLGEFADVQWMKKPKDVPGADSLLDGLANTQAMAAAGSDIAKTVLDLVIDGVGGWHIPALDQMTVLRPTLFPRAGIVPAQTIAEAFKDGGPEAFETECYWTSTQYSAGFAWLQGFGYGYQYTSDKDWRCRVRAVRKFTL